MNLVLWHACISSPALSLRSPHATLHIVTVYRIRSRVNRLSDACSTRLWLTQEELYDSVAVNAFSRCCLNVRLTAYRRTHTHTHTRLTALCPGLPGWAGTRKVKPNWILLKEETVSGSGISWAICKSAPRSRQITMPATHCSVFYRPDATQPTASTVHH